MSEFFTPQTSNKLSVYFIIYSVCNKTTNYNLSMRPRRLSCAQRPKLLLNISLHSCLALSTGTFNMALMNCSGTGEVRIKNETNRMHFTRSTSTLTKY